MTPPKIILSCLAIFLLGYVSLISWDLTREKPLRQPTPCPRVTEVSIYYDEDIHAWMGEFVGFVGRKQNRIIVGSVKSRDAVIDAIEWYCNK